MSDTDEASEVPWGYLLPMRDGPPPLELRLDNVTVGSAEDCALHVDATLFGLPADAAPQVIFTVRRDRSSGHALLRSEIDALRLNKKEIQRGFEERLKHGAAIVFDADEETYVFVSREESDSFKAPSDVTEEYIVGHRLGGGGFGRVYMLFGKYSNYQRKAMKVVEPKKEEQLPYAIREARIVTSLEHPCVIKTFSINKMGHQHFLVMEYMPGGDLSQFVNNQRHLSEAQTKLIFFQLALAVKYLHQKNVCHRDLKPANILLQQRDPKTLIKVTDFGLAKNENDDSTMDTIAGSRPYIAPDVLNKNYTHSVDVWSMGVILFYSLMGVLPFKSFDDSVRRNHEVKYDKDKWNEVSLEAKKLVKRMLNINVDRRVSVLQVLEDSWLCDGPMREDAFHLTGLEDIRSLHDAPVSPTPSTFETSTFSTLQDFMDVPTGLENHDPSSPSRNDDSPWAYLLPLQDDSPPLELKQDCTSVGSDTSSNLVVDAIALRLPTSMEPQVFFAVRRDTSSDSAALRCEVDGVRLNGKVLQRGQETSLEHGECIGFKEEKPSYVFVSQEESDSFIAPTNVLEENLIGHCIGEGRFGKVHILFEKKENYRRKAMKILQSHNSAYINFSERQASILLSLKHPCMVEIFSITQLLHQHFLIMEHIDGGDLTQFVNDQCLLSEAETKLIFFQIALAVKYLHKMNISYCILSPENIMLLSRKPHTLIKLSSFDLLKQFIDESTLGTWAGSPYVAPEITAIEESYPGAVDVWSMGVILFYSLTGALPFKSRHDVRRHDLEVKYDSVQWGKVTEQAQLLVKYMLRTDIAVRLSISQVIDHPWLSDDVMREDAFRLTGLEDIRSPSASPGPAGTSTSLIHSRISESQRDLENRELEPVRKECCTVI